MPCLVLLLLCLASASGQLEFNVIPDTILPGVNQRLDLNCSLDGNFSDVSRVLIIQIEKMNGTDVEPLASITTGETAKSHVHHLRHNVVSGVVSNSNPMDSFLELSTPYPDRDDAGRYRCAFSVLDHSFLLHNFHTTADVIVAECTGFHNCAETTDTDATTAVIEELRALQKQVSVLSRKVHNAAGGQCSCGGSAAGSASSVQHPLVAFTARPTLPRLFEAGRIQFDSAELNVGGAFSPERSEFVAPVNGTYMLTASVSCQDHKTISEIKVNNQTVGQLATLGDDQSTLSLVLPLMAGDVVWLEGIFSSNDTRIFADDDTLFSGYLIR